MADPQTPRPRRIWRVLFGLSLALNVAVVGIVLGVGLRDRVGGHSPRGYDLALGPVGRALDKDDRREIGEALRRNPALRPMRRAEARQMLTDFSEALRATPFSEADLTTVMETAGGRTDRLQAAAREALVAHIVQMTDAERSELADRIENPRKQGN